MHDHLFNSFHLVIFQETDSESDDGKDTRGSNVLSEI